MTPGERLGRQGFGRPPLGDNEMSLNMKKGSPRERARTSFRHSAISKISHPSADARNPYSILYEIYHLSHKQPKYSSNKLFLSGRYFSPSAQLMAHRNSSNQSSSNPIRNTHQ
jgi:hypothetical protein